jgi:hypothetical protein
MLRIPKETGTDFPSPEREALAPPPERANLCGTGSRMKTPLPLLLRILPALLLAGCATNPAEQRIQKHPERFAALSPREKDFVLRGEVTEGMSQDAVFLAWGRPGRVMSGSRDGRGRERWAYFRTAPVSTVSVGYGGYGPHPFYSAYGFHPAYGYGYGPGWGYGSGVDYVPYLDRSVEFVNGRVVAWERNR